MLRYFNHEFMMSCFTLASEMKLMPINTLDKVESVGPFAGRIGISYGIARDARGIDGIFEASGAATKNGV